ncbi:MAG: hypothetical protein KGI52_15830 [Burkholderiales bacterium]|nr:hypothetical protein [Burkholderiales bacterium]
MPYQTGTATSPADLQTKIAAFATANGWTANGAPVKSYSQAGCYFALSVDGSGRLVINGGNGADGTGALTGVCAQGGAIYLPSAAWPATYHLFAHTAPVSLWCVVNYSGDYYQWLAAGNITTYGTYTGGNWFGGWTKSVTGTLTPCMSQLYGGYTGASGYGSVAPFMSPYVNGAYQVSSAFVHCELDGALWPGDASGINYPTFSLQASPLWARGPNVWNAQTVLLPWILWLSRVGGYTSPIGHIAHLRAARIDNYTPGDIITLGPDRWKIFPWWRKDTANPLGNIGTGGTTGTLAFVLRYDGP